MYQRYPRGGGRRTQTHRSHNYALAIIIVLVILCIALGVGYLSARGVGLNTREALMDKALNEVSQGRQRAYQVSQTGGSSTYNMLGLVRQHVYSTRVLNELCSSIYGSGNILIDESSITRCVEAIDQCESNLATGSSIASAYTDLRDAIDALYQEAASLKGEDPSAIQE